MSNYAHQDAKLWQIVKIGRSKYRAIGRRPDGVMLWKGSGPTIYTLIQNAQGEFGTGRFDNKLFAQPVAQQFSHMSTEIKRYVRAQQRGKCPRCGTPQPKGPETISGACYDCDRTSPSARRNSGKTIRCKCGETVHLDGDTECPKCGQWYNAFGQRLKPPSQWQENGGVRRNVFAFNNGGIRRNIFAFNNSPSGPADEQAARELELFIENDADLYRQQYIPIVTNLMRKRAKGVYDSQKAVKLFMYLMESGAKKYINEFGTKGDPIDRVFNKNTREMAARTFRDSFEGEAALGNWDHLLVKVTKQGMKAAVARRGAASEVADDMAAVEQGFRYKLIRRTKKYPDAPGSHTTYKPLYAKSTYEIPSIQKQYPGETWTIVDLASPRSTHENPPTPRGSAHPLKRLIGPAKWEDLSKEQRLQIERQFLYGGMPYDPSGTYWSLMQYPKQVGGMRLWKQSQFFGNPSGWSLIGLYTNDSDVTAAADRLRATGIQARVDEYAPGTYKLIVPASKRSVAKALLGHGETCRTCGGSGRRATARSASGSELARHELYGTPCPDCGGIGRIIPNPLTRGETAATLRAAREAVTYGRAFVRSSPTRQFALGKAAGLAQTVERFGPTRQARYRGSSVDMAAHVAQNPGLQAFDVYLNGKKIDTIFYGEKTKVSIDEVRRSLIDHDGYDPSIEVKKQRRKARRNCCNNPGGACACSNPLTVAEGREISEEAMREALVGGQIKSPGSRGYHLGRSSGMSDVVKKYGPDFVRPNPLLQTILLANPGSLKTFNEMQDVGKSKYVVNYHDGVKAHRDGSPFFDIAIFSSRAKKDRFVRELESRGFTRAARWNPPISQRWGALTVRQRHAALEFAGIPDAHAWRIAGLASWSVVPARAQQALERGWHDVERRSSGQTTVRRAAPVVANPGGSIRIPFREGQRIPVEKARAWVKRLGNPELLKQFEEAERLQTRANRKPKFVIWKTLPIGSPKKVEMLTAFAHYGESPETMYKPPKGSKKGRVMYRHEWGDGSGRPRPVPVLAAPSGKAIIKVMGSGQRTGDWMRG